MAGCGLYAVGMRTNEGSESNVLRSGNPSREDPELFCWGNKKLDFVEPLGTGPPPSCDSPTRCNLAGQVPRAGTHDENKPTPDWSLHNPDLFRPSWIWGRVVSDTSG